VKQQGLVKFVKFRPTFCNFILCWKIVLTNSHKYFHVLFALCEGGTSLNKSQKGDIGKKSQDILFSETGFVHSRSGSHYVLFLGSFGLKILSDIRHCVYWILAEILVPDTSHKIFNKFFIHHCQGWKQGSFVWKLFDFFPRWILILLTWNLSRFVPNSVQILTWNFRKKLFRDNFSEICEKPRLSFMKILEISPYFLQFYYGLKNSHKYFYVLFAPCEGGTSINKSQKDI